MWNQDGNFDVKAKKNQHDRRAPDADSDDEQSDDEGEGQQSEDEFVEELAREPLQPSNESEEVNALDVFASAGVQGDDALAGEPVESEMGGQGGDQDPVNHAPTPRDEEGEGNGEAGDGDEQVWHPYIRAIISATAAEIAKIKPGTRTRIRIGTHASRHTHIHTHSHTHTHAHAFARAHMHIHSHTHTHMHAHAHTLIRSYARTLTHTHTHTLTHTQGGVRVNATKLAQQLGYTHSTVRMYPCTRTAHTHVQALAQTRIDAHTCTRMHTCMAHAHAHPHPHPHPHPLPPA